MQVAGGYIIALRLHPVHPVLVSAPQRRGEAVQALEDKVPRTGSALKRPCLVTCGCSSLIGSPIWIDPPQSSSIDYRAKTWPPARLANILRGSMSKGDCDCTVLYVSGNGL